MSNQFEKLENFRLENFEELVGDEFTFDNQYRLILVEARAFGSQQNSGIDSSEFRSPFSLLFEGRQTDVLSTGIHTVWHKTLQQFPLSINPVQIPVDRSANGSGVSLYYESVFT